MANTTLSTRIVLRNDSLANWDGVKDTAVLLKGEIGIEFDPNADYTAGDAFNHKVKFKIGDGVHTWATLPYYEETFDKDFVFTSQFGKYEPDDTGSVTVAAKGKTMSELLMDAYATEDTDFSVTNPSITLTAGSSQGYKAYEVGSTVTPTYSISFDAGKYPYGPDTGVVANAYAVTFNGETLTSASGTFASTVVTDGFSQRVSANATYNAATVSPNSNLGNPVDAKKIDAGTTETKYGSYMTGYRSFFYGYVTKELDELTSDDIRGLTNGGAYSAAKNVEIKANGATDVKYFIVAIPKDSTRGGVNKVESTAGMTVTVTDQWTKNGKTMEVADARGGENGLKEYYISYWTSASIDSATVHKVYLA
jgi:hypothetical protein